MQDIRRFIVLQARGSSVQMRQIRWALVCGGEQEMFAALSIEEVIAYVRNRQPSVEILELKVLGKVQVLSSSEHL
jgi:hypothetical protein